MGLTAAAVCAWSAPGATAPNTASNMHHVKSVQLVFIFFPPLWLLYATPLAGVTF
jgi:hypothetical protein